METFLIDAGITVFIMVIWFILSGKRVMTPHDIYRKLEADVAYIAPESVDLMLLKTRKAIAACEEIYHSGPRTEAGEEAVEVLAKLRRLETGLKAKS